MIVETKAEQELAYSIVKREAIIEDIAHCEYGIRQYTTNSENQVTDFSIEGISTDKEVVEVLLERINNEILDFETLHYIVEDYLGEIFGL